MNIPYSYLDPINKEILIEIIIKKQKNNSLSSVENQMFKLLDSHILFNSRDLGITENGEDIFGYKIATSETNVKYMAYKDDKFSLVDMTNKLKILKNIKNKIKSELPPNKLIIYMFNKNNKMNIKIKEKNTETKLTKVKTGSICGNEGMKKDTIVEYINKIKRGTYKEGSLPSKDLLCLELDIYIRLNELNSTTNNARWFYTAEEAIEREINLKKN